MELFSTELLKILSFKVGTQTHTKFQKEEEMKSTYDNDELFDIERTLVETIARSMDALNVDGTRKNISEYFDSTLLPEVIEEMSVIQRCNK